MAGWLVKALGYGVYEITDPSSPDASPTVSSSPVLDTFARIMQDHFYETEEARRDRPASLDGGYEFIAVAPTGSSVDDLVWDCVRCTWENKKKIRFQYRQAIAWTDRNVGW